MDYTRATNITEKELKEIFTYAPWNDSQVAIGSQVRQKLQESFEVIVNSVPSSPLRTRALNAIIDARMLANAAITFNGKY
jgi:enoyl-[acyl-carrier-protein] reductase (NADH)